MAKTGGDLRELLSLLIGETLIVHWLDSGADHALDSLEEVADAELATATSVGVLGKVDDESLVLIYFMNSYGRTEFTQIALNCVLDVDVYSKGT